MASQFYPPSAEIEISAPVQCVWQVLLDGPGYPDWNSFVYEVHGDLKQMNEPVGVRVVLKGRKARSVMKIIKLAPPGETADAEWVHQYAGLLGKLGLLGSERHHELTSIRGGTATRYKTWEPFWGILKPIIPYQAIDAGFKMQALDLKHYCEVDPV